jgi:hypothetical protein
MNKTYERLKKIYLGRKKQLKEKSLKNDKTLWKFIVARSKWRNIQKEYRDE